jgi:hypothetical protein
MSQGSLGGHLQILVARRQLYAGGDVKFPSSRDPAIVDYDYRESCMSDVRYDGIWLPMDMRENHESIAAEVTRFDNIADDCNSTACIALACILPRECVDLWRLAECRCPGGQRWVPFQSDCVNINECVEENPCVHGDCLDMDRGYKCECHDNWGGEYCDRSRQASIASVTTGAIMAIVCCVLVMLLLLLLFIVYSRRRRPDTLMVGMDPDDDVRENIIHYDEEGVGEEDQDAYDINRLKKPVGTAGVCAPDTSLRKTQIEDLPKKQPMKPMRMHFAPGEEPAVGDFITGRLSEADDDPAAPPLDSIREFAYEGSGSVAGSLSSLGSTNDSEEQCYDYLDDWGPRFNKLSEIYQADLDTSGDTEL